MIRLTCSCVCVLYLNLSCESISDRFKLVFNDDNDNDIAMMCKPYVMGVISIVFVRIYLPYTIVCLKVHSVYVNTVNDFNECSSQSDRFILIIIIINQNKKTINFICLMYLM